MWWYWDLRQLKTVHEWTLCAGCTTTLQRYRLKQSLVAFLLASSLGICSKFWQSICQFLEQNVNLWCYHGRSWKHHLHYSISITIRKTYQISWAVKTTTMLSHLQSRLYILPSLGQILNMQVYYGTSTSSKILQDIQKFTCRDFLCHVHPHTILALIQRISVNHWRHSEEEQGTEDWLLDMTGRELEVWPWHIPLHALFAVLYRFFLPVLSRPFFTSRTPNKDQKTEQLFYLLFAQIL